MTDHPATYTDALLPIMAEPATRRAGEDPRSVCRHWQDRAPDAMASTSGILRLRDREGMGRPGPHGRLHRCTTGDTRAHALPRRHVRCDLHQPNLRQPHGGSSRGARTVPKLATGKGVWCTLHNMAMHVAGHTPTLECDAHMTICPKCRGEGHNNYVATTTATCSAGR